MGGKRLGLYVVIEGIEGAGKSTLSQALCDSLSAHGVPVHLTSEPRGTEEGRVATRFWRANDLSQERASLVLGFARLSVYLQEVLPALGRGEVVISDRSVLSNLVYQPSARDLILQLTQVVGCAPDLMLLLDTPAAVARERRKAGGMVSDEDRAPLGRYEMLRHRYRRIAGELAAGRYRRSVPPCPVVTLAGTEKVPLLVEQTQALIDARYHALRGEPLIVDPAAG